VSGAATTRRCGAQFDVIEHHELASHFTYEVRAFARHSHWWTPMDLTMDRTTHLALRGIDASEDSSVLFRFSAAGKDYTWRFNAATLDELVALGLDGRLGKGRDVHFDAARVSFQEGREGKPDMVTVAIGRKVRIVAPVARRRGKPARQVTEAVSPRPERKARVRKKSPAA
jgi:hypothetical protein